jgi:hypothetical protein
LRVEGEKTGQTIPEKSEKESEKSEKESKKSDKVKI